MNGNIYKNFKEITSCLMQLNSQKYVRNVKGGNNNHLKPKGKGLKYYLLIRNIFVGDEEMLNFFIS